MKTYNSARFTAVRNDLTDHVTAIIDLMWNGDSEEELLSRLSKGIKKWVASYEKGKKVIDYNGGDFNFGDLALYQDDNELVSCLSEVGIDSLRVEIIDTDPVALNFDTCLI
jgi:hypothetical protein